MVEISPKQEGLVHISELAPFRVNSVEDVVKIGDVIPVKIIKIDEQGRVDLSAKDAGFSPKPVVLSSRKPSGFVRAERSDRPRSMSRDRGGQRSQSRGHASRRSY